MRTRPAHGGFPGEVVVRWPATDAHGLLPLGDVWVDIETLRALPASVIAAFSGATVEEVYAARGWTDVRHRTPGL